MTILAIIGGIWRRIPWQLWVAAGLLAGVWWFGQWRYDAGQADVQGKWNKAVAEGRRVNQATEDGWRNAHYELAYKAEERRIARNAETELTIACLRDGTCRVRDRFTCPKLPRNTATAGQSESEVEYGLGPEDAEFLVRFADERDQIADERNQCIASYNALRVKP